MTTSHTPGPWTISASAPVDYALSIHGAPLKQSGGFPVVADILERTTDGTHEANARLIAAAPELLDACRKALYALKGREHDGFLRAAIAKATGAA